MKSLPIVLFAVLLLDPGARAQEVPPPPGPQRALLTLQLRGAQRGFTDQVKGVMLEHDNKNWDLLITGAKGTSSHTCEVHSTDRGALFDLQRTMIAAADIQVSCVNGTLSSRGGVLIDLDDPKGGSFILGATRP
jgi:hypothetical protein